MPHTWIDVRYGFRNKYSISYSCEKRQTTYLTFLAELEVVLTIIKTVEKFKWERMEFIVLGCCFVRHTCKVGHTHLGLYLWNTNAQNYASHSHDYKLWKFRLGLDIICIIIPTKYLTVKLIYLLIDLFLKFSCLTFGRLKENINVLISITEKYRH